MNEGKYTVPSITQPLGTKREYIKEQSAPVLYNDKGYYQEKFWILAKIKALNWIDESTQTSDDILIKSKNIF